MTVKCRSLTASRLAAGSGRQIAFAPELIYVCTIGRLPRAADGACDKH